MRKFKTLPPSVIKAFIPFRSQSKAEAVGQRGGDRAHYPCGLVSISVTSVSQRLCINSSNI